VTQDSSQHCRLEMTVKASIYKLSLYKQGKKHDLSLSERLLI
jgi:hypothetical protein